MSEVNPLLSNRTMRGAAKAVEGLLDQGKINTEITDEPQKEVAKDEKKAAKKTPEEIAKRRAKATDIVQSIGRSLAAAAGDDIKAPETTKMEEYKKGKRIDLSGGDDITEPKATTAFDTNPEPEEDKTKTPPVQRKDLHNISSMMRKIKNPLKK